MHTSLRALVVLVMTGAVVALGAWQLLPPAAYTAPGAGDQARTVSGTSDPAREVRPATRPSRQAKPQRVARTTVVEPVPVLEPGPTLYGPGDSSAEVREIQARLRQIAWFYGDVTDDYGDQTRTAVAGFQGKRGFPVTGEVDRRTLDRLHEMTSEPTADELDNVEPEPADGTALDPRCTTGRAICIDKSSNSVRWVVDGKTELTLDARFGGDGYVTREGVFSVTHKSRDHVSSLYDTSMPFAMFFSGGQAVHYSPDFAANGYAGASHGCVNIRDYDEIAWLYEQVGIGDKVIVYWS
jgi:peptidoglycan hydrolase-like protein with peptidoglycan-binding domain